MGIGRVGISAPAATFRRSGCAKIAGPMYASCANVSRLEEALDRPIRTEHLDAQDAEARWNSEYERGDGDQRLAAAAIAPMSGLRRDGPGARVSSDLVRQSEAGSAGRSGWSSPMECQRRRP